MKRPVLVFLCVLAQVFWIANLMLWVIDDDAPQVHYDCDYGTPKIFEAQMETK